MVSQHPCQWTVSRTEPFGQLLQRLGPRMISSANQLQALFQYDDVVESRQPREVPQCGAGGGVPLSLEFVVKRPV